MAGFNLKDVKEVEKYLENLSTEYRFGCYHEKKPEVCHLLGDFFEAIKRDWSKAGKIYEVNCNDHKWGHSCFKFGNYLYMGKGSIPTDHEKSLQYFDKGCEYKYGDACLHAGVLRTSPNTELPKDSKTAYEKLRKGCELDNGMSCFYVSGMFLSGIDNFLKKDMNQAFTFAKKACDLGNIYACANLAQMYAKGDGTPQNPKKAEEYKQKALEMQEQLLKQFRGVEFGQGG